ncbi:hypothetical protein PR001_g11711 [Phytophthora rubi]|uniref:P-type domain-containing protein n=1 Tax=Phytophthora rubi TaxID=129364 RepID=A0A6A3MK71_9STRA|nr:hypothetical protein PR001_g11711 [Phytophthora rubi]
MVPLQLALTVVAVALASGSEAVNLVSAAVETSTVQCANEPTQRVVCYPPSPNFPEPTEELCLTQGCCWKSLENEGVPCAFAVEEPQARGKCKNVAKPSRLACRNPRFASLKVLEDEDACESAGCCFDAGDCFQPMSDGYELLTLDETGDGWHGTLALRHGNRGPFGNDVPLLELHVSDYKVHFTPWPFGVAVTRRHSGEVLFNSTPPIEREEDGASFSGLVFENQFLEFSTQLAETEDGDDPAAPTRSDTSEYPDDGATDGTERILDASYVSAADVIPPENSTCDEADATGTFKHRPNETKPMGNLENETKLTGYGDKSAFIPDSSETMLRYSEPIGQSWGMNVIQREILITNVPTPPRSLRVLTSRTHQ